ncbi:hypothetical protein ACFXHA_43615 [Nocardia sp. NPDC059240]|uniref:hypothetical protein n=1 Tax=Nocardia sp. NPDC059240 TaxID=3346786 RepID=UPI00369564A0
MRATVYPPYPSFDGPPPIHQRPTTNIPAASRSEDATAVVVAVVSIVAAAAFVAGFLLGWQEREARP